MNGRVAMADEDTVMEALLAPLPQEGGAGMALRYEPVYQQIQEARQQDDASLPMGDWDRPLQRADWRLVAALCQEALAAQGKDLQVAAWLCEAWMRLNGLEGLVAGIRVLDGLAQRYWETAWPRMEDEDDAEARCAPFSWLDATVSLACTLHLPLLRIEDGDPPEINLYDWERAPIAPVAAPDPEAGEASAAVEPALSRDALMPYAAQPANRAALQSLLEFAGMAEAAWAGLERGLDKRLGQAAPSLRRTPEALARLARVAGGLLAGHSVGHSSRPGRADPAMASAGRIAPTLAMPGGTRSGHEADAAHDAADAYAGADVGVVASLGQLSNRAQAYRQLSRIADYLAAIEPHSPTPYLLRKAVAWGDMSLSDLMNEVAQEEGGMARYLSLLNG
ncbi:type VI secretion system protein TssA [Achromobacter anxifer]|jgi:type VI secretion system protein ImpA|uniref:type VI secretion system protein TssA n=1 Tax=Achromobacter anxifer TaxID=1287737 RepID=UPI0023F9DFB8|nr:type VI secretion system protein TssA [Achromobacter anxifer]MDF8364750.1 type VI secretion system protein TssA [Achromobacter anxifer]